MVEGGARIKKQVFVGSGTASSSPVQQYPEALNPFGADNAMAASRSLPALGRTASPSKVR